MQTSSRRAPTQTYQHLKTAFPYLTSTAARFTSHHSLANEWSPKSGTKISNTATAPLPKQPGRPKLNRSHPRSCKDFTKPGKGCKDFRIGFFSGRSSARSVLCSWRERLVPFLKCRISQRRKMRRADPPPIPRPRKGKEE